MYSDRRVIPATGDGGRQSERRSQIFDRKLVSRRFCACAVKIGPNSLIVLSNRHNFSPFIRNRGRLKFLPISDRKETAEELAASDQVRSAYYSHLIS